MASLAPNPRTLASDYPSGKADYPSRDLNQVEESLHESEARFRTIFNQTTIGIAQKNLHGRFLMVNDRYCEIVGRTREELMSLGMQDVTHPDDLKQNLEQFTALAEGRSSDFIVEKRYVRPDQSVAWVRDHVSVVRNTEGQPAYVLAAVIDITERRCTEEALRDSDARLRSELLDMEQLQSISAEINYEENAQALYDKILDAAVAIMRSDFASMQMLYPERGNGGELRLLAFRGFNPEAAKFWEWVRADSDSSCAAAFQSGQRVIVADIEQCDWMTGTEDLAMFRHTGIRSVQSTPLISRGGKLLGMISTHWRKPHQPSERCLRMLDIVARQAADLIDRRIAAERQAQAEVALRKSEKFAAAGRMAATIAHEINNPLEAMVNLWYLLGQEEELSESGHAQLKLLGEELGRVTHITKQTLEFYREGKTAAPFELADPINAAVKLFSRKAEVVGARIETRFRTSAAMFGFAGEMRQVFANLIGNSLEAGATRIQVRVSASRDWTDLGRRGVRVMFADNGSGIAKESARKLFEPFFTTKDEKGTGLGLWTSKGIVQKHEGRMRVRSSTRTDRRGTTFYLFLPTIQDRDVASKAVQPAGVSR